MFVSLLVRKCIPEILIVCYSARGIYYLETNPKKPYAKGYPLKRQSAAIRTPG